MLTTYRKLNPLWLSAAATLAALACGCASPKIDYAVGDTDPSVKIPAIKIAAEGRARDGATVRQLVKDLDSDDAAVRFYAIEGLRRITGESFGYEYYDEEEARKPAVQKWQAWLSDRDHTPPDATANDAPTTQNGR